MAGGDDFRVGGAGSAAYDRPPAAMAPGGTTALAQQDGEGQLVLSEVGQRRVIQMIDDVMARKKGIVDVLLLPEPERTAVCERLSEVGATFRFRSLTRRVLRVKYGPRVVLEVPPNGEGKEFIFPHAVQIASYHAGLPTGNQPGRPPSVAEIVEGRAVEAPSVPSERPEVFDLETYRAKVTAEAKAEARAEVDALRVDLAGLKQQIAALTAALGPKTEDKPEAEAEPSSEPATEPEAERRPEGEASEPAAAVPEDSESDS